MSETPAPSFLSSVRVLDFSILGPGGVGAHLVDFGADVIKVEPPAGDYLRETTWPIVHEATADGSRANSLMHLHINRGKRSIALDLRTDDAREVFADLVRVSDVVIEGMRPGVLDRLGFPFERLRDLNSRIVVCSISGYGATGPYRNLPSHGVAYDAWSGALTPTRDEAGFTHIPNSVNIGITAGPAFAALDILAALLRAREAGHPAYIELAQSDAAAYFDWYRIESEVAHRRPPEEVTGTASDGGVRRRPGLGGMYDGVRYQLYESADGHVLLMASEQRFWRNFCEATGRFDLYERWPGARVGDHAAGNTELHRELRQLMRTRTTAQWIALADEHDTAIAPVNTPSTLVDDPQFGERSRWVGRDVLGADQMLLPVHLGDEALPVPTHAPAVGEHTDELLTAVLGYDANRCRALRDSGAVA